MLGGLAACTLTTDFDGLSGGAANTANDGGQSRDAQTLADGRVIDPSGDGGNLQTCGDTSSDPHNCGQCKHDCLGGACDSGKCQPFVLAQNLDHPLGIGLSQGKLYLGIEGALLEIGTDGKDSKAVVSNVRPKYIWGTDTDVFFSRDGDTIERWPHSSDGKTELVLGAPAVSGVSLSPTHLYFTRYQGANQGGGVYRVSFPDVGTPEKLKGWNGAECVNWADGKTYFAGDGQDSANLLHDDGSVDQLLENGGPTGIFVLGNDAFITRQGAGELLRVDLTTKQSELLAHDLDGPSGIVATVTAIYWVELHRGTLDVLAR